MGPLGLGLDQLLYGNTPHAATPNSGKVGQQYLDLVRAFTQGEPDVYGMQAKYQPMFENLDLQGMETALPAFTSAEATANTAARTANLNDVKTLGPGYVSAIKAADPGQTALTDQLTKTASDQLALGTTLDPASTNRITSGVRSNWAGRGLGDSMPAGLDEALQLFGGGENLLTQREGAAEGVAGMDQAMYENPLLSAFSVTSNAPGAAMTTTASAGPTLFPAQQSYDMFNTTYNANAAANNANANNAAAERGASLSY